MIDIHHRVGIRAARDDVLDALTTLDGVRSWWSRDAEGDAAAGGELRFRFGRPEPRLVLHVDEASPDVVAWRCCHGPDEWLGTTMTFAISEDAGEVALLFTHAGWREAVPFEAHCSTKWAFFLLGLKSLLEGGQGTPFPGELQLSSWG
jgi:hypothetical protein